MLMMDSRAGNGREFSWQSADCIIRFSAWMHPLPGTRKRGRTVMLSPFQDFMDKS